MVHTHTATQISDSTTAGRALLTAATVQAQRTALDIFVTAENTGSFPVNGNFQRVYIAGNTSRTYAWNGSSYIEISSSVASVSSGVMISSGINGNFDNLNGLTKQVEAEWWSGVPIDWSGVNSPYTVYSGIGTNNYVTNVAKLSAGPLNSFRQNLGRLPITSDVKLTFTYSALTSYFYQDNFNANNEALNGRTTATGFGNWATTDSAFQVGGGQITINSNTPIDYHTASFPLPSLRDTDILSLSITLRPAGPNFMGFGFNPNPATGSNPYLTQNGYAWVYFEGLGTSNPNIQIFRGSSTSNQLYVANLNNPALNFDASLPTTFQYTYSALAKTLTITATNGINSSVLLNNLDVSTIPLSVFRNFALQFQGQALGSDTNPAYVDNLSVSIIPEPSVLRAAIYDGNFNNLATGSYTTTNSDTFTLTGNSIPANTNIIIGFWAGSGNPALNNVSVSQTTPATTWIFPTTLPRNSDNLPSGALWVDTSAGNVLKIKL